MAPSVFDGRQITETTVHEYDGERLVRSVTTRDPEWTELDQAEMLALSEYRASLCPLHGGPLADCMAHEDTGPTFVARSRRCRAQDEVLIAQNAKTIDRPGAVLWTVVKQKPGVS